MADRYWVGGTASWDATAGTKWALTDGGAGGQTVPSSTDNVFFTAASGAVTVTKSGAANCLDLDFTGFTGTFAGTGGLNINGSLTAVSGMTWTHTGSLNFLAASGAVSITPAGKTFGAITIGSASQSLTASLVGALTSSSTVNVSSGTFNTDNYSVTATSLQSNNSNTRTINLGSSTVTLSATGTVLNFITSTGLTFNAGTSQITVTADTSTFSGGAQTFYNVSFTSTALSTITMLGSNTFNDLTVAGRTSIGVGIFSTSGNLTVNGTLTFSAGTNATRRTFVRSNGIGATRTLTCAAVASPTDIDFRDITIAGAAAPISGTRLGDCKGNSGITFDAAKTVYWNLAGNNNWSGTAWATSAGGSVAVANFPLAQDTAIFTSTSPATGATTTINAAYNIGTIDMSARTSNTMTLAIGTQTPAIYGDWINGTGTTLTGAGTLTFTGRGSQTITSAGKTFTQQIVTNSPSGSVTLQDALNTSFGASGAFDHVSGTFDANGYNVTVSSLSGGVASQGGESRTLALGAGTWAISGTGGWNSSGSGLTVTGTGTISLNSSSAKTFAGDDIQTYPTIRQGGGGTLTITGSNKFANITNSTLPLGRVQFTGGTTNEFTAFNLKGTTSLNRIPLGSTNTTQATLIAPSWNVGTGSLDSGNNTGLSFTAGTIDFLNISYINGVISGGAYVITANNGTYTVTGQTASLLRGRLITANNGTYTVAGQTATLSRSRLITSDTGYYNVVGYPATIVVSGGPPIIVTDQLLIKLRSFTETRRF
jgi:hypothetical protein